MSHALTFEIVFMNIQQSPTTFVDGSSSVMLNREDNYLHLVQVSVRHLYCGFQTCFDLGLDVEKLPVLPCIVIFLSLLDFLPPCQWYGPNAFLQCHPSPYPVLAWVPFCRAENRGLVFCVFRISTGTHELLPSLLNHCWYMGGTKALPF